MPTEESLITTRQSKHQAANGSTYPLAQDGTVISNLISYCDNHTVGSADPLPVSIDPNESLFTWILHGRITALRKSGALTFIKVADATGSIQLIATKMYLNTYDDLRLLDLGDILEVEGKLAWSKTHERSVLVTSWKLLSKAIRPAPEKFLGIQDTELKYRHRYLDLMSSEESRARFTVRSYMIRGLRHIMDNRGFLEVETSTLSTIASGANAKPFITKHNALDIDLRLRIAPELNLKRLLVGGMDRVYEIGRVFRNEGIDTRHNPEFTIMETYEAYASFQSLIMSTEHLLRDTNQYLEENLPKNVLPFYLKWKEERTFSLNDFISIPMEKAVLDAEAKLGVVLASNNRYNHIGSEVPSHRRLRLINWDALNKEIEECSNSGQIMDIRFQYLVEPFLTQDYRSADGNHSLPVFITEYPKEISPLARSNDTNSHITDRFELYVDGRELANAFQELNDPKEQAIRFQEQLENNGKDPIAYDADYVQALEHGMPPAIGLGMGIDRLAMLLTGTSSIKDVILFPTLRPLL